MITLSRDLKSYLEPAIAHHCTNRVDVGLFAFSGCGRSRRGIKEVFSYNDTIAIAALVIKGFTIRDAAAYVRQGFVAAAPHRSSEKLAECENQQHELRVGFFRLADGGIWSVTADIDTKATPPSQIEGDFFAVATRGATIVDEDPVDHARHLVTECDARGLAVRAT
ncbi:hypothetical protein FHT00_003609 [Sphingomonas insulae]|uniref:Uncharacterized protein n=1 Tax=Sphingomonas insulae TaxID=424800 RepID=A0ABN1I098_9SPHN|nr:hypothetical protein [Sphingomonas insulae]NIJ31628.1 hypothetical protein [Sphingomonas insulae]